MNSTESLFDAAVAASGLMELIAPYTVSRLLISAGADPRALSRDDLERALPHLEKGLAVYLDEDQLAQAMTNLRNLTSA